MTVIDLKQKLSRTLWNLSSFLLGKQKVWILQTLLGETVCKIRVGWQHALFGSVPLLVWLAICLRAVLTYI